MALTDPAIPVVPFSPDLAEPLSFGPTQPIVLFPVRIETRFFPLPDGGADLCVRVYPDKVHIDTHEPALTEQEIVWGKHFWEQAWRAAKDEEAQKIAWRQLAERFDPRRAAWVAQALTPLNPEDRPVHAITGEQAPPAPIKFPSPATKSAAWTRAPLARALPKRWYVLGYFGGKLVVRAAGNPIPDGLAAGPDPSGSSDNPIDGDWAIDNGMKWMVDYAEAEKVGMGIRVRLTKDQAQGFDILLVLGTKAAPDVSDQTRELVNLLDAHHYADGLAFVLQGTPSNNTPDAPSGFSSLDSGQDDSYLVERGGTTFRTGDGSNADALTTAFGLHNGNALTLANIANANAEEQVDARHMNRALWGSTWGYFLAQMMGVSIFQMTPLTPDDFSWGRQHFIDYVRAAGPLPAVRVGKQPYGVLPVTSLDFWKPKVGQEQQFARDVALQNFLMKLREIWRANLPQVPRIGRSDNSDQDFADTFSLDGISSSYAMRHLIGGQYLRSLWSVLVPGDQTFWWNTQQQLAKASLNAVGLNWDRSGLSNASYSGWYAPLTGPITQPEMLSESAPLEPNYIELLLNELDLEKIHKETFAQFQPKGLLYAVLRHGLLLEFWSAALSLLFPDQQGLSYWVNHTEQELVGATSFTGLSGVASRWELLSRPVPGVTGDPVGSYLASLRSPPTDTNVASRVAALLEFRESLAHLQTLSAAKLQRNFAGTLDLCSHRLDAWITSFATKRLAEMRKARPAGILLGGYGWVMNLKPAAPLAVEIPPIGEQGVFLRPANNPGYTQTPSLAQAATVAVLRSGHLTHSDAATKDLLAIDLSSERVRLAEWLLDGVRQGQPLGALLGYRFERHLQDAKLGQFIPFFREVAPLVAKKLSQTTDQSVDESVELVAANNVVDGLVLHRHWKDIGDSPIALGILFRNLKERPNSSQLQQAESTLRAELNLLDHAVDALSDAFIAESVYHAVQGNPLRTASTLDAVASGEAPPPELEVVLTPRTGVALTHRLVALFGGSAVVGQEWVSPAVSPRANAEPYLNAWVAKLLGNPARVRCVIERIDPATAEMLESKELRLNELDLAPLDFIYSAEGSRDAQPSELRQRILYSVVRRPNGFPPDAVLRINPSRAPDWASSDLSYGEYTELLRAARQLITGARGIDASELDLPEQNRASGVDIAELQIRADNAAQALRQTQTDLQGLLDKGPAVNLEALRDVMLHSAQFGVAGAVPFSVAGSSPADRDALLLQAKSVAKEFAQRLDRLTTHEANFNTSSGTAGDKRNQQLDRLRSIFGNSFVVLPQFSVANATDLERALADSAKVQDNDALTIVTWFQRASRVREGVARFDASIRYAEALETGEQLNLRIAQLPYREGDRWVGLPLKPGQAISPSRYSLVVQSVPTIDVKQPMTGLLIDEWVEAVPNATETTGMVFQYDQPDAAPPQCILLAVPPDLDQPWNLWSLQQVLLETLDLARIRAVDPDVLEEGTMAVGSGGAFQLSIGHYLPALYFAVNSAGDTISTDFLKLK